jgi:hypothetical protein
VGLRVALAPVVALVPVVALAPVVACTRSPEAPLRADPPPKEATVVSPSDARPADLPPTDDPACRPILARFRARLATATAACTTSADCGCYPGGVGDCGGVTDLESVRALIALHDEYVAAKCRYTQLCAPRACAYACTGGRCVD